MGWTLHFADASGALLTQEGSIRAAIAKAQRLGEARLPPVALDVIVQNWPGRAISGRGHVGYAPTGDMIQLTFDAGDPGFAANLGDPLVRSVLHELHHVHRWRGPGYGRTLGEALLSEGLAGHFVQECCSSEAELWETAVPEVGLARYRSALMRDWAGPYDHAAWFFGTGAMPPWLGYSMGYSLVRQVLKTRPGDRPSGLVGLQPDDVTDILEEDFA